MRVTEFISFVCIIITSCDLTKAADQGYCLIPLLRNGVIKLAQTGMLLPTGAGLSSGSTVQVVCNPGYAVTDGGSTLSICQQDGTFSPDIARCLSFTTITTTTTPEEPYTQCDGVPAVADGFVTDRNGQRPFSTDSFDIGTIFKVACNLGYQFDNKATTEITLICLPSGVWSVLRVSCQRIPETTCSSDDLPIFTNGRYLNSTDSQDSFAKGSKLFAVCENGFTLSSGTRSVSTFCQTDGQWSPFSPGNAVCQVRGCSTYELPQLRNGHFATTNTFGGDQLPTGFLAPISCDSGYSLNGSLYVSCQSDGTWSQLNGSCLAVTCDGHRCGDGQCIPKIWFCDTRNDCMDGSDERNCSFNRYRSTSTTSRPSDPLIAAAISGNVALVNQLLDQGADIETKDKAGDTSLIIAAFYGHDNVVRILLDRGANIDATGNFGETALILAARQGKMTVIKQLVERGAFLDAKMSSSLNHLSNHTAVMSAARNNRSDIVTYLYLRGASLRGCQYTACNLLRPSTTITAVRVVMCSENDVPSFQNGHVYAEAGSTGEPPRRVGGRWAGSQNALYEIGSSLSLLCDDGYQFDDKSQSQATICQRDGSWSLPNRECISS